MRACFCPACGTSLNFEGFDRDFAFCQYCGTKIMLDDHRETHRVIDEARIIEAQSEHEIADTKYDTSFLNNFGKNLNGRFKKL